MKRAGSVLDLDSRQQAPTKKGKAHAGKKPRLAFFGEEQYLQHGGYFHLIFKAQKLTLRENFHSHSAGIIHLQRCEVPHATDEFQVTLSWSLDRIHEQAWATVSEEDRRWRYQRPAPEPKFYFCKKATTKEFFHVFDDKGQPVGFCLFPPPNSYERIFFMDLERQFHALALESVDMNWPPGITQLISEYTMDSSSLTNDENAT